MRDLGDSTINKTFKRLTNSTNELAKINKTLVKGQRALQEMIFYQFSYNLDLKQR